MLVGKRGMWWRLVRDERGQDLVEYLLLLVLIAIVVLASVRLFGNHLGTLFQNASDRVPTG